MGAVELPRMIPDPDVLTKSDRILVELGIIRGKVDRIGLVEDTVKGMEARLRRTEESLAVLSASVKQTTNTWGFMWQAANTVATFLLALWVYLHPLK